MNRCENSSSSLTLGSMNPSDDASTPVEGFISRHHHKSSVPTFDSEFLATSLNLSVINEEPCSEKKRNDWFCARVARQVATLMKTARNLLREQLTYNPHHTITA